MRDISGKAARLKEKLGGKKLLNAAIELPKAAEPVAAEITENAEVAAE
jgi:hypothetical protein